MKMFSKFEIFHFLSPKKKREIFHFLFVNVLVYRIFIVIVIKVLDHWVLILLNPFYKQNEMSILLKNYSVSINFRKSSIYGH